MNEAIELLKESRECIAACFRTMYQSTDKTEVDRLECEFKISGVKDGIGVRIQDFIKKTEETTK